MADNTPIMQFFQYEQLPEDVQPIGKLFHDLVIELVQLVPRNSERSTALRKLLEAKDAAIRAKLFKYQ
jgi:hypothetical protein